MEDTKKIPSKSTWLLYWLTETKVTGTGPTWLCTRLGPVSERRSGHRPPSLTQKLPLIDKSLANKSLVYSKGVSLAGVEGGGAYA